MPINVQLTDANFSLGPSSGFFYSCSFGRQELVQVEADGDEVDSFPVSLSTFRRPVKELHYDGTFFWTLEDLPSNLGLVIKKWRLFPFKTAAFPNVTPVEFRWQDELTLINMPHMRWSADAFATEHYHRTLNGSVLQGSSTIRLNSVANINAGDVLYLGPSTFAGFEGNEEKITATSVDSTTGDVSFFKSGGLENSYISSDPVDFVKSIFVFNKHSFSGSADGRGALVQFSYPSKTIISSDVGYGLVSAADFYGNKLSWVRAFQIIEMDLADTVFDFNASQEANLVEDDKATLIEVFDLISDLGNNQYLKLQTKETTEDLDTGILTTTDFGGKYNFQAQPTLTFVNSVAFTFDTRFSRRFATGDTIAVTAEVRDQFNFPVFNETVQFSSALSSLSDPGIPGTFSPSTVITNTSGIAETTYTPSITSTDIIVDLTAKVL